MRYWPYKFPSDNWKTLKAKTTWVEEEVVRQEYIDKKYKKNYSGDIVNWLEEFHSLPDKIIDFYDNWDNNSLDESSVHIEDKLDFFDMDKVDAVDYDAMRLLVDNRSLSIENDWYDINKDTIIYIRDRWANIREKIILKDLFKYLWFYSNNYRKKLNNFMDNNNILEINISTKNPEYSRDDILPKHFKWSTKSKMLNGWIIADDSQIKWKPNNYDYLPWKNKKNHKKAA